MFVKRQSTFFVNIWYKCTKKKSKKKSFMVVKSFTELIYGRERQAIDQGESFIIELRSGFAPVSVFVGISVDVFHTELVQSGATLWVTSLRTQLHCKTISNAEKLPRTRSCSFQPVLHRQMWLRGAEDREGGKMEPRLSNCNSFSSRLAPKRPFFCIRNPNITVVHHWFYWTDRLRNPPDWWLKVGNPFFGQRNDDVIAQKEKKNSLVASKGKWCHLLALKHLNMSDQPCIVGNVGTTFKKKRLNKSRLSLASLQLMLGFPLKNNLFTKEQSFIWHCRHK